MTSPARFAAARNRYSGMSFAFLLLQQSSAENTTAPFCPLLACLVSHHERIDRLKISSKWQAEDTSDRRVAA